MVAWLRRTRLLLAGILLGCPAVHRIEHADTSAREVDAASVAADAGSAIDAATAHDAPRVRTDAGTDLGDPEWTHLPSAAETCAIEVALHPERLVPRPVVVSGFRAGGRDHLVSVSEPLSGEHVHTLFELASGVVVAALRSPLHAEPITELCTLDRIVANDAGLALHVSHGYGFFSPLWGEVHRAALDDVAGTARLVGRYHPPATDLWAPSWIAIGPSTTSVVDWAGSLGVFDGAGALRPIGHASGPAIHIGDDVLFRGGLPSTRREGIARWREGALPEVLRSATEGVADLAVHGTELTWVEGSTLYRGTYDGALTATPVGAITGQAFDSAHAGGYHVRVEGDLFTPARLTVYRLSDGARAESIRVEVDRFAPSLLVLVTSDTVLVAPRPYADVAELARIEPERLEFR